MEALAIVPGDPGQCQQYSFPNNLTVAHITKAGRGLLICHQAVFLR